MARGYPGAFGRKVNSPFVWIALTLLFVVPFVDPRRLLRMRHLDLAVLMAFGVSVAFFNDANIDVSVPLAYPLMALPARAHAVDRAAPQPASRPAAPARAGVVAGHRAALPRRLSHRAQRRGLERHRRRLRGRHRRRPPGRRRQAVGRLPQGQRARRHLRAGDLRRLRALRAGPPLERALGRPARRPRRVHRLRPAVPGPALPHRPAHARADPRHSRSPTRGRRTRSRSTRWTATSTTRSSPRSSSAPSRRRHRPPAAARFIALAGMAKFAPLALAPLFATYSRGALRFVLGGAARARAVPAARPRLRRPARLLRPHAGLPGLARLAVLDLGPLRVGHGAGRGPGRRRCCWPWPSPSCRAGATSSGSRRWRRPCSSRCSSASRTGSTSTSCGSSGRLLIALLGDAEPAERRAPPSYAEQLGRLPAPAVAWR